MDLFLLLSADVICLPNVHALYVRKLSLFYYFDSMFRFTLTSMSIFKV